MNNFVGNILRNKFYARCYVLLWSADFDDLQVFSLAM